MQLDDPALTGRRVYTICGSYDEVFVVDDDLAIATRLGRLPREVPPMPPCYDRQYAERMSLDGAPPALVVVGDGPRPRGAVFAIEVVA